MHQVNLYPLTHPQKRIWHIEQIYPNTSIYNIGGTIKIIGSINLEILKKAIILFISNNPGTRIQITLKDDQPYQYKYSNEEININIIDFKDNIYSENAFNQWVIKEARIPFSLLDDQLFKICIFRISDDESGYFVKFHHIISDGFSTFLMTSQIIENYNNILNKVNLPDEKIQFNYLEYIEIENQYLDSIRFQKNKEYWINKFDDLDEIPNVKNFNDIRGNRKNYIINEKQTKEIKDFCNQNRISLNTFYSGIFLIYLYKMNGNKSQVIGIPVLNRSGKKEKNTFGMFTSTMPFRFDFDSNYSISNYFNYLNKEFRLCFQNQKYPYNLLAQDLELRKHGFDMLFNICINYYNLKHITESDGLKIINEDFYSGNQIYSLQLIIREWLDTDNISLSYDYKIVDYNEEEIEKLNNSINEIIERIIHNSDLKIHEIDLLTEQKKKILLYDFNSTQKDYPRDKSIHVLFEEQVEKTPNKIAITQDEKELTYKELNEKSNQIARYIQKRIDDNKKIIIPIVGNHSIELIADILGILKANCSFLPIDPKTPIKRIQYIINETNAKLIICNNYLELKNKITQDIIDLNNPEIYLESVENLQIQYKPDDLAYIIYTSGSTGTPKGVMIRNQSLVNYIFWAKNQYIKDENDVFAFYSSISFDLTITSIFTPLISGTQIRVFNPYEEDKDFVLYRILEDNKSTIVKLTPSHLTLIKDRDNSISKIKRFIIGGEDLKTNLAAKIYYSYKGNIELYNEYGPTEATVGCMIYKYDNEKENRLSIPIGKPADNCQIYILDKSLKPVPESAIGELYISGECLSTGYYRNDKLTTEKFVENPFITKEKLYKTSDLARFINDGCIEYIGRNDSQIKIRGNRIELGEIEKQILTISGINNVIILKKQNNNKEFLCAYIIAEEKITESFIRNYLSNVLPDYMIPSYYMFLYAFPLSSNGKVNIRKLPEPSILQEKVYENIHPTNEKGTLLLNACREILDIDAISLSDNFYHIGGDSIKAIQISSYLRNIGYIIKIKDILSNPVLNEMINYISNEKNKKIINNGLCKGEIQNTPIVCWFFSNNFPNSNYYNQSVLLELKFDLQINIFKEIMNYIIIHHDTLRLNYNPDKKQLFYNEDHLNKRIEIKEYDLSVFDDSEKNNKLIGLGEEVKSSFDIENSLLFSCCLFKLDAKNKLLLLTAHHLVIDGISWRILLDDLKMLFEQSINKQKLQLNNKTYSYQEWADYIYNNYKYEELYKDIDYWNSIINNNFALTFLKDYLSIHSNNGDKYFLSETITKNLLSDANIPYKTKGDELLIIALALTLNEWTNSNTIIIELESHGRNEEFEDIDISNTIGWFTSIYPIKLDIMESDLNSQIKSLKEQIRSVRDKGIGYGILRYIHNKLKIDEKKFLKFNYLGDFSQVNNKYFELSSLNHGDDVAKDNYFSCLLDINALIIDGKLTIFENYNQNLFEKKEIDYFIRSYIEKIKEIITFCVNKQEVEFTPSDFDTINLTQEELDSIL